MAVVYDEIYKVWNMNSNDEQLWRALYTQKYQLTRPRMRVDGLFYKFDSQYSVHPPSVLRSAPVHRGSFRMLPSVGERDVKSSYHVTYRTNECAIVYPLVKLVKF